MKTKKKPLPEIEVIFPRNQVKTKKKKRSSPQFGRKFVRFFSPSWLFFLWSSSAQLSMGGRLNLDGMALNLDGGCVPSRPPYNLSTGAKYILLYT